MTDVVVVGAGPAGMSAALELRARGFEVTVVDDQPAPGGRIFAAIETRAVHGAEDRSGFELVRRFRESGGTYLSEAEVWQIEQGTRVFLTSEGRARVLDCRFVLLASGAQERPMPFPGWELPGVMTVGAAQILLKTARQVPDHPVWLAGTGPLLLLYAHQLLAAGGKIAGILDTTPPGTALASASRLPAALRYGWRDLLRGLPWLAEVARLQVIRNVTSIEASGSGRLERLSYVTRRGRKGEVEARLLLIHDGVVPAVHGTLAAGCEHRWNAWQRCFEPVADKYGRSSVPSIFVAGDGASVLGARAAVCTGKLAALGIAVAAGSLSHDEAEAAGVPLLRKVSAARDFRRLIDSLYPPVELAIPDGALICRCEEVTAGDIRAAIAGRPSLGPDGAKIATRAGMGPCQGRQCGPSLNRVVSEVHGVERADAGFLRIRPPLKPLTLAELAALDAGS